MNALNYQQIPGHAEQLSKLFKEKGYAQEFHFVPPDMTAPLTGGLRVLGLIWKSTQTSPIPELRIETITHELAKQNQINCSFSLKYQPETGFQIREMEVLHRNQQGLTIDVAHFKFSSNDQLPTRQTANESVTPQHRINKLSPKKGLHF